MWLTAGLLVLSSCAQRGEVLPAAESPATSRRFEVSTTVLENSSHGPSLCLGVVLYSFPPQCGGVPVTGWDWDMVDGETRAAGTIWGRYRVVGTFNGATFALTERPGTYEEPDAPADIDLRPGCPEPAEGWERPRPADTTEANLQAAIAVAQAEPDFAGLWTVGQTQEGDVSAAVLNVAFTGGVDGRISELRKVWGGALCVVQRRRSIAELERIRTEATEILRERGVTLLSADADEVRGVVALDVVWFEPDDQAVFDARFGEGVVVLNARLRPVQ